ncbi:hypothetical protein AAFC00_002810 [Neodothiora populina]|uniref:Rhomboid-type serine protease n=1 Tax=Neodothiora populina TaxID=2781224 RepID=A0ABR3P8L8_9PEZI
MASFNYHGSNNAYYNNDNNNYGYDRREDAPLPALPQHQPSESGFEYPAYYEQQKYPDTEYHRDSPSPLDGRRPLDETDDVPMRPYNYKHSSQSSTAPVITPVYDDPFVRDADPRQRRKWGRDRGSATGGKKKGWFSGRITWVCYTLSLIQLCVFIAEMVKNAILTKSPIEIHPQFNPMIGPSPYVLINMGARYVPCMHNMANIQNRTTTISWPCPNATSTTGDSVSCTLSDLCGFSGVPNPHPGGSINDSPAPDQWFRFIVPIFLHAGIVHIGFNLLLQLTLGRDMELSIGAVRFFFVYFASGIFGFVLGGNFAATGIASTGCSGSLFGILALTLLELLYTWRERPSPVKDLLFILVDVIISFVLGLLPGLDNFSHIGGFAMGLVLGVCVLRSPNALRRRTGEDEPPYSSVAGVTGGTPDAANQGIQNFIRQPIGFFKGRRGMWWVWWIVRALALLGALVGFILLLKNFYVWNTTCSWCKYLSCLPVNNWCSTGNLQFTSTSGSSSNKRDLLTATHEVFGQAVSRAL